MSGFSSSQWHPLLPPWGWGAARALGEEQGCRWKGHHMCGIREGSVLGALLVAESQGMAESQGSTSLVLETSPYVFPSSSLWGGALG